MSHESAFKEQTTHCFDIAKLITAQTNDVKVREAHYTADGFKLTFEYVDNYTYEVLIKTVPRVKRL